jgi:hypothetical protein
MARPYNRNVSLCTDLISKGGLDVYVGADQENFSHSLSALLQIGFCISEIVAVSQKINSVNIRWNLPAWLWFYAHLMGFVRMKKCISEYW